MLFKAGLSASDESGASRTSRIAFIGFSVCFPFRSDIGVVVSIRFHKGVFIPNDRGGSLSGVIDDVGQ